MPIFNLAIAGSLQLPFPAAIPSHQFLLHICPARLPWETGTASPSVAKAAPSVSVPAEVDKALPAWASSQKTFIQGLRPFHQFLCDWKNSIQSIRNVLIHVEDSIRFPQDLTGSPSRTCISIMVKTACAFHFLIPGLHFATTSLPCLEPYRWKMSDKFRVKVL